MKKRKKILLLGIVSGMVSVIAAFSLLSKRIEAPQVRTAQMGNRPSPDSSAVTDATPPSDQIVFAGISGNPPRFIDSGPNRGTGWMEYQTLEVRRGMRVDGFHLKQEYMTPARIAHEIKLGNPICTYPVEWNHPEKLFAAPQDRLYSIALDFGDEGGRSILFHKADQLKFQKYIDSKGDLDVDSLLEDQSLRTVLIRDKDYGRFNQKLTEFDAQAEQAIRKPYQKHVSLMMVRDNRQLIEMLNAKRFDYIFSDSIEEEDFKKSNLPQDKFNTINYQTISIKDLADPALARISIACSIHPLTLKALPYFNKWIHATRAGSWKADKIDYRSIFDKRVDQFKGMAHNIFLAGKFNGQLRDGTADAWYLKQQAQVSHLDLFPQPKQPPATPTLNSSAISRPNRSLWHALYTNNSEVTILNEARFYHRSILDAEPVELDRMSANNAQPWSHLHLGEVISEELKQQLFRFEFSASEKNPQGEVNLASLSLKPKIRSLTLFASGLLASDLAPLIAALSSRALESLTVFDASPSVSERIMSSIGPNLISLNLTNSSLYHAQLSRKFADLTHLRHLHLNSTQLGESELKALIRVIPEQVESLSLGWLSTSWSLDNARAFGQRKWASLKRLDLAVSGLDDAHMKFILPVLPDALEKINLSGNFLTPRGMVDFYKRRFRNLSHLSVDFTNSNSRRFPADLSPVKAYGSLYGIQAAAPSFSRFPTSLENLILAGAEIKNAQAVFEPLFKSLAPRVAVLNLSNSQIPLDALRVLVAQNQIQHIERLDLSSNRLGDEAIEILSQAHFSIDHLNLYENFIQNRGAEIISRRWLPQLKGLNLSKNPITDAGSKALAAQLPAGLIRLELQNLFSIDISTLSQHLPKTLRNLNLSNNQLSDSDLETLLPALPKNLYDLNLSGSALTSKGAAILARWIPPHLSRLDLLQTRIERSGAALLFSSLPQSVSELYLGPLDLDSQAVASLAKSLPPQLRRLHLQEVSWTEADAGRLLEVLPRSLQSLFLHGVPVGEAGAASLARHWPDQLRLLEITGGHLGNRGIQLLSQTLPHTLERLILDQNQIQDAGLIALAERNLEHVLALGLTSNSFTERGIRALNSKKRNFVSLSLESCNLTPKAVDALGPNILASLRRLRISNNRIGNAGVLQLMKNLSPAFFQLYLASTGITAKSIDEVIRLVPAGLSRLILSGNLLGEKGTQKLKTLVKERAEIGPDLDDLF